MNKIQYYFKPNGHWNIVTEDVFNYLIRFYDCNYVKMVWE